MKKSQELSALVVEQEEEFSRKMRGMQVEVEKKDHALKVAQVVVCDYIVDLDKVERPIKALKKKGIKRRSTKKPLTTQSGASLPKVAHKQAKATAKVNKGSISNFSPTCYFCHIRGHKKAQCAKYVELCKNRNMLRRKVRKVREVWIRKDKLDQLKRTPFVARNDTPINKVWVVKNHDRSHATLDIPSSFHNLHDHFSSELRVSLHV